MKKRKWKIRSLTNKLSIFFYVLQHRQSSDIKMVHRHAPNICLHECMNNSTYMTILEVHLHDKKRELARLQISHDPLIGSVRHSNNTKCRLNSRLETRSNGLGSKCLKLLLSIWNTKFNPISWMNENYKKRGLPKLK